MDQQALLRAMDDLIEVSPGTLKGPEKLADLEGWTSLAMIGFISFADRNGVRVSPRTIATAATVAELIGLLERKP